MDFKSQLKQRLSNATLRQLEALWLFANSKDVIVTSSQISDSTSTAMQEGLAGLISSISKMQTEKGPLILRAGRVPGEGTRWRLNEDIITQAELADLLISIDPTLK
jgi:hypothetical protein